MCKWFLTAAAAALAFVADPAPAGAQVIVTTRYANPYYGGYVPNYGGYSQPYGGYVSNFGGYSPAYGGSLPYGYGGYSPYTYSGVSLPIGQGGLVQAGLNAAMVNSGYGSYPMYQGGYGSYQSYSRFAPSFGGTGYETYQRYSGYTPYYGGSGYGFTNPGYYPGGRGYYYGGAPGGWRR